MAAVNFPNSPSINDTFTVGNVLYQWDGTVWNRIGTEVSDVLEALVNLERPDPPSAGDIWFDPSDGTLNVYFVDSDNGQWVATSGPASESIAAGAGGDQIFWENEKNVTTDYTITSGKNAVTAGP